MAKQFIHNELDPLSKCEWSITHDDVTDIEDAAAEHLLKCSSGYHYREDSGLLRATIRATIIDTDSEQIH